MPTLTHVVESTKLYKRLVESSKKSTGINVLPGNVLGIVKEVTDILRRTITTHPQFTLHDEVHSCRVVHLMAKVLGDQTVKKLSCIECAFLILSAYLHD